MDRAERLEGEEHPGSQVKGSLVSEPLALKVLSLKASWEQDLGPHRVLWQLGGPGPMYHGLPVPLPTQEWEVLVPW